MSGSPGCGVVTPENEKPRPMLDRGENGLPFSRHVVDLANRAENFGGVSTQQESPWPFRPGATRSFIGTLLMMAQRRLFGVVYLEYPVLPQFSRTHIPQPTLVERAAPFEPFGPIVREQPARGGRREYTAGGRCGSAGDCLAEVYEPPFSVEREGGQTSRRRSSVDTDASIPDRCTRAAGDELSTGLVRYHSPLPRPIRFGPGGLKQLAVQAAHIGP